MKRVELEIDESSVTWKYANNTVIIGYDKPDKVKQKEAAMLQLAHKAAVKSGAGGGQGDCKQQ